MELYVLDAEVRSDLGKGASRRLRRTGKVPAVIYGGGKDPMAVTVSRNELHRQLQHEGFYSHVLTVKLPEAVEKAVLKDVQRHPSKPVVMHIDLQRVSETETIHVHVPLHFLGEQGSPAVKMGNRISHLLIDVEVVCLPKDLPEYIEVDLSSVEEGQSVHLSDLKLPSGVEIVALTQGEDQDVPVISIQSAHAGAGPADEEGGPTEGGAV
jgi:large subunit ribosomal protein L25